MSRCGYDRAVFTGLVSYVYWCVSPLSSHLTRSRPVSSNPAPSRLVPSRLVSSLLVPSHLTPFSSRSQPGREPEWRTKHVSATSTTSSTSSGSGSGSVTGSGSGAGTITHKVTEMATIFQRGRTTSSPAPRRDKSLERDAALVRSESHLARFNSARAMFESMTERPVERRQSAKERSRPTSLGGASSRSASAASRLSSRSPSPPADGRRLSEGGSSRNRGESEPPPSACFRSQIGKVSSGRQLGPAERLANREKAANGTARAHVTNGVVKERTHVINGAADARRQFINGSKLNSESESNAKPSDTPTKSPIAKAKFSDNDTDGVTLRNPVAGSPSTHSSRPDSGPPSVSRGLDEIPTRGPSCADDQSSGGERRALSSRELVNRQRNWISHFTTRRSERDVTSPERQEQRRLSEPTTATPGSPATTPGKGRLRRMEY